MDEYNWNKRCIKCGGWNIGTKYKEIADIILRTCAKCGYWWHEEPLDRQGKDSRLSDREEAPDASN